MSVPDQRSSARWKRALSALSLDVLEIHHSQKRFLKRYKRRGDEEIETDIRDIPEEEALALAAKLNTTHGKKLSVLELAERIRVLTEEQGWSQRKAATYFKKSQAWISDQVIIAKNLSTTLTSALVTLTYDSARELSRISKDKQTKAYRLARKMAMQDRRPSPSSKLMAKVVKNIRN